MRALTGLLVLVFTLPAVAQVTKQERAGIVNFSKVDAVVACGGATDTAALDGLKADGFKAIINLRTAGEQGANLEQNAARAKELGIKYISIPFSPQQPDPKAVDTFLGEIANKSNQPVFVGQPRRLVLARQARAAGRVGHRQGHRRSEGDWTSRRAAREVRARLHRDA